MRQIILSGVSRGIGAELAKLCIAAGDQVIGLSRQADQFKAKSEQYTPVCIDFSNLKDTERRLKALAKQFPNPDILVCNAGIGAIANVEQMSLAQMETVMAVNFHSQVLMIKAFLPAMKKQQAGKILVVGSESALKGGRRGSLYCASKFALRGFCQSLREECRNDNIAVSMIHPGIVRTQFFDDLAIKPSAESSEALTPECVAASMLHMLNAPAHAPIEELTLQAIHQRVTR